MVGEGLDGIGSPLTPLTLKVAYYVPIVYFLEKTISVLLNVHHITNCYFKNCMIYLRQMDINYMTTDLF